MSLRTVSSAILTAALAAYATSYVFAQDLEVDGTQANNSASASASGVGSSASAT